MIWRCPGATPGFYILFTFVLEPPARAKTLVDTVIAAAQSAAPSTTGNRGDIASQFHINHNVTQGVTSAEFTDAQSHQTLVQSALQNDSPVIKAISGTKGVRGRRFQRFDLLTGRVAPVRKDAAPGA